MRAFIAENFPMLAMWLSIGIGLTDRKGVGGGGGAATFHWSWEDDDDILWEDGADFLLTEDSP